ncbi:14424_t:CDS:2 [Entrophospora sp. SA101]|nr:14424_t:CDS:2 [Entrophospora sp. SA101]CAJ0884676.1 17037_t:CDS:2 [Entrophospora sp. SA101]CAJ0908383.1 475_t:CDS:2 [Entrophospora sp. SA101]
MSLSPLDKSKRSAAYRAVDVCITSEVKLIGIGSGSTVLYVIERILQRSKELNNQCVFIPTSFQSRQLIIENGLNLGDIDQYPEIDVDEHLNAIKGGGACQLREKVVAEAAKKFVLVADYTKKSKFLGEKQGVPIEVVSFTYVRVMKELEALGCEHIKLRMAKCKAGPIISDNGNFIVDAYFGLINEPGELSKKIKLITGVVEVGLFVNMAKVAYFGNENGSVLEQKLL